MMINSSLISRDEMGSIFLADEFLIMYTTAAYTKRKENQATIHSLCC